MFQVRDRVVHPMHGAGVIEEIVDERINGQRAQYYVFRMSVGGLVLKIPIENCESIGIRPLSSTEHIEEIIAEIPALDADMNVNWNHRYRENMDRIKSGDLLEVSRVIKGLMWRDRQRGLSNGERKMLHSAKQILISEIVLVTGAEYTDVEQKIDEIMMLGDR